MASWIIGRDILCMYVCIRTYWYNMGHVSRAWLPRSGLVTFPVSQWMSITNGKWVNPSCTSVQLNHCKSHVWWFYLLYIMIDHKLLQYNTVYYISISTYCIPRHPHSFPSPVKWKSWPQNSKPFKTACIHIQQLEKGPGLGVSVSLHMSKPFIFASEQHGDEQNPHTRCINMQKISFWPRHRDCSATALRVLTLATDLVRWLIQLEMRFNRRCHPHWWGDKCDLNEIYKQLNMIYIICIIYMWLSVSKMAGGIPRFMAIKHTTNTRKISDCVLVGGILSKKITLIYNYTYSYLQYFTIIYNYLHIYVQDCTSTTPSNMGVLSIIHSRFFILRPFKGRWGDCRFTQPISIHQSMVILEKTWLMVTTLW
jgi:hypothetical protein